MFQVSTVGFDLCVWRRSKHFKWGSEAINIKWDETTNDLWEYFWKEMKLVSVSGWFRSCRWEFMTQIELSYLFLCAIERFEKCLKNNDLFIFSTCHFYILFHKAVEHWKHIDLFQRQKLYERCFLFRCVCFPAQHDFVFEKLFTRKKNNHCFILEPF